MNEDVRVLRRERYVGVAELAAAAARLVGELVPAQERASVAEVPDERTVRYYLAEGLLSPASGKRGTASLYGYRQLLQLLAVKRLQADHLPIRKIKELIEGKTEEGLERLLGLGEEGASSPALDYLESLLEAPRARQPELLFSLSRGAGTPGPAWVRVEIEPGLELHLRDDYRPPAEAGERRRLARRLLEEINRRSGAPEE